LFAEIKGSLFLTIIESFDSLGNKGRVRETLTWRRFWIGGRLWEDLGLLGD
jgi:hypothetical protein